MRLAHRSGGSLVDASGYKFADKDTKPGKIKLKKPVNKNGGKKKADGALFTLKSTTHAEEEERCVNMR